jgi:predicted outer membrane repeat protein
MLVAAITGSALGATITVGPNLIDFDYITLTAAIAGAQSGDEIIIQPDIYPENLLISGKDLSLRNAGGGEVIIFGQGLNKCLRVSGAGTDVVLEGLTFRDGFSTTFGGGVAIELNTTAQIIDCVIEDSHCTTSGGGLYMSGSGTITGTILRNNTSDANGGGLYLEGSTGTTSFIDCQFIENGAVEGGGLADGQPGGRSGFVGCRFSRNSAVNRGGAIAVLGTVSVGGGVRVKQGEFVENRADLAGGAVWVSDGDIFWAENSLFVRNSAGSIGGALRNEQLAEFVNCTLAFNEVDAAGVNDTLESNRADADTRLLNCIVVNASAGSHAGPGDLDAFYSLLPEAPSGTPDADGSFNADPMFVDPEGLDNDEGNDFMLIATSPAIDAGDSLGGLGQIDVTAILLDLAGRDRNVDDPDTANTGVSAWALNIDLGAFEFQPADERDCLADLNGDGILDLQDVTRFVGSFTAGCP